MNYEEIIHNGHNVNLRFSKIIQKATISLVLPNYRRTDEEKKKHIFYVYLRLG